ncbi:MAG TPA: hypothetical protein VIQ80_03030 [Candidatus Saccharimonadales bacterium]
MKRFLIASSVLAALIVGAAALHSLTVLATTPMTEAHIERIRSSCVEAQSTLSQLHATDALLRVNRGQLYESMSTKLMEPFDSRLALNNYNTADLVSVASTYDHQLTDFRTKYQQYEESMSDTLKINCRNQPVAFYDSVTATRDKRENVHQSALLLHKLINDYQQAVEAFAKNFKEPSR